MTKKYPMYLAGQWVESDIPLDVINPYNGEAVGLTWLASADQLEQAIVAAQEAFEVTRKQPVDRRPC